MSLLDYHRLLELAAPRRAHSVNHRRLASAFPEVVAELVERYSAPGGATRAERVFDDFEEQRS